MFTFYPGDLSLQTLYISCTDVIPADAEAEAYLSSLSPPKFDSWDDCASDSVDDGDDPIDATSFEPVTPLNNNPTDTRAHGYGMADNVFATVHMQNGAWQYNAGGIPQELIDYGVLLAIDVWEQGGDQYFDHYERVCVLGEGRMMFLDATQSPRPMTEIVPVDYENGYTCGWIPNAGTVVIIEPAG